jgi:glucosamine--fructose-6-phosphate aminotransferase (isomerizing)
MGIDAVAIEAGELLHYRMPTLRNAVTIIVSRSGESIEITRMLQALKGQTPIIAICNEPQSSLSRSANISILIGSHDDDYVAVQTYTGTLLTQYLLANAVAGTEPAAQKELRALLPAFTQLVQRSYSDSNSWDEFLRAASPIFLVARGPSCASSYEGALLFNEVAKTAAVGMAAGSFRHGPVEVVDKNFVGLLFAPQGPTHQLNMALANDLATFGGRIRILGPSGILAELPQIPEGLAPIFEIVPVQLAALRLAQLKGIAPGTFRYAPRVAVDEANFNPLKES